jgi:type 2 lantibiotic biosynthesis protein LanM
VALIRTSLAFQARGAAERPELDEPVVETDLVATARAIADDLLAAAVRGSDGSMAWLSLAYDSALGSHVLRPTSDDLYDGRAGIALFLAASARVTGAARYGEAARACVLSADAPDRTESPPVGGAVGIGSRIYGLTAVGRLLGDSSLIERAVVLSRSLTRELFRTDERLDVMHGTAGALLALCALHDACGEGEVLERLRDGLRHLLDREEEGAWPTLDGIPQTGFSHGAAGIAYAFTRSAHRLGDAEASSAGERALRWETSQLDPEVGNWRDLRREGPDAFTDAWCHGATGIGLARLATPPTEETQEQIRADIETVIHTNLASGLLANDHLCCGNAGRLAFLFEAGIHLDRPDLVMAAKARANEIVHIARISGGYAMVNRRPGPRHCWDFFHGIAGIGHTLLRLAHPDLVPQPLLWEV